MKRILPTSFHLKRDTTYRLFYLTYLRNAKIYIMDESKSLFNTYECRVSTSSFRSIWLLVLDSSTLICRKYIVHYPLNQCRISSGYDITWSYLGFKNSDYSGTLLLIASLPATSPCFPNKLNKLKSPV